MPDGTIFCVLLVAQRYRSSSALSSICFNNNGPMLSPTPPDSGDLLYSPISRVTTGAALAIAGGGCKIGSGTSCKTAKFAAALAAKAGSGCKTALSGCKTAASAAAKAGSGWLQKLAAAAKRRSLPLDHLSQLGPPDIPCDA